MIHLNMLVLFVLALLTASPLFAQDMPGKLDTLMDQLLATFTGDFVRGVLVLCLCGCAVAYGFNKDNEKMKRNIIAIAIAIAILAAASMIIKTIYEAAA
jgi:peptidoglycan/LPS O-acetylase OafA/YrhL